MANPQLIGATIRQGLERRLQERHLLSDQARAGIGDGEAIAIIDVSKHGFKAISLNHPEPNEVITVMIGPNGPFDARIVWKNMTIIGCEFLNPLSPQTLSAILDQTARPADQGNVQQLDAG